MGWLPEQVCRLKAIAYCHGPDRIHRLAKHFAEGCKRHGIYCEIRHVDQLRDEKADIVWLYGLGPAKPVFDAHEGAVRIVGDKGYFHGCGVTDKYFRISVNAQQPDAHMLLRERPSDRWKKLGIKVKPVDKLGDYVLLCGMGPKQAARQGYPYGDWETETYHRLTEYDMPVLIREKPKNPPIGRLPRSEHASTAEAIRRARVVLCMTGNIGVDAILHGVPVFANSGPGRVYYPHGDVNQLEPMGEHERIRALSDIAYWQWTQPEMANGDMLENLKFEGII